MSKTIADLSNLIFSYYPHVRKTYRDLVSIKGIPISMTQLTCLSIIAKNDGLSMSQLADSLSMSNQQLTKVVDALVEFEMVERVISAKNRRKITASATQKGKDTLDKLQAELDEKLGKRLRSISDDEIDKLYYSIQHVASYFGKLHK